MTLAAIIERRREAVLREWRTNHFFQIQVDTMTMLGRAIQLDVQDPKFPKLGRRAERNVFYVPPADDPYGSGSLWVSSSYGEYRAAYLAFINLVHRTSFSNSDLAGYDADHLLNRKGAPEGGSFIRLEAVSGEVNQAWGSFYERYVDRNPRSGRKLRWTVASKLANQMPPVGPDDDAGIARLIAFWMTQGYPREQVEDGLRGDIARTFGRPWTPTQPTLPWI